MGQQQESSLLVYWDTSAVLSALFRDANSDVASDIARTSGVHLLSSLAWAEAQAVIARLEREGKLNRVLAGSARELLEGGPWRRVHIEPVWEHIVQLAERWPLRGADLWHLSSAKELQDVLPELRLLSYDARLVAAAAGEGLEFR